jgi:hypothetical protein
MRYCPIIILFALALFCAAAHGGLGVGVTIGETVGTIPASTGTGTGTAVTMYAYYSANNYSYGATSVLTETISGRNLSQTDIAEAPLLQSRGGKNCLYFFAGTARLVGTSGSWPNCQALATYTVVCKFELASTTMDFLNEYQYYSFTRASSYAVWGMFTAYNSNHLCNVSFHVKPCDVTTHII